MCTPWYTLKGLQEKPSHEVWFHQQLDLYTKWGPEAAKERKATGLSSTSTRHSPSLDGRLIAANPVACIIHESTPSRSKVREDTFRSYPWRVVKVPRMSLGARGRCHQVLEKSTLHTRQNPERPVLSSPREEHISYETKFR